MHPLPYREGILAIIVNSDGDFLLLQPQNYAEDEWNFLGGGIEDGETPEQTLYREIKEETGIKQRDLQLIGKSKNIFTYEFPEEVKNKYGNKYQGARRHPFILTFTGSKENIQIAPNEIRQYIWVPFPELQNHLKFPGQYETAKMIIEEFGLQ